MYVLLREVRIQSIHKFRDLDSSAKNTGSTSLKSLLKTIFYDMRIENLASVQDFEDQALQILSESVKNFYLGTAKAQRTTKLNKETFQKYRIRPKSLRDVSQRDISTTILGEKVSMPLGVSPTGYQKLAHPDGECANARAVEAAGTIFIMSSATNSRIQDVAKAAPKAIKWQQLLIYKDRDCTKHFVRRAEEADFKAIVVIIDSPIIPKSKNSRSLMNSDITFAIFEDYFSSKYTEKEIGDVYKRVRDMLDDTVTWQDISWLKSITKLPIVVKGVLTAEDALAAANHGASAVIVSNHGGRQLESTPTTIEALPEIVAAVGNMIEVYVDGGVRQGTDVFKALALGAKMVFVGRPMLWGLVCDGEKGAKAVLNILRNEIDETFALTGCRNVQDVTKDLVKHESLYSHL